MYLNLFADATVSLAPLAVRARGQLDGEAAAAATLRMVTDWPYSPNVTIAVALPAPAPAPAAGDNAGVGPNYNSNARAAKFTLMLRIPAWLAEESVRCAFFLLSCC